MSIYGTILSLDTDHRVECAVYEERPPGSGIFEFADGNPACTCGLPDAPLIYASSHVLPSDDDERGGYVECASISGCISRTGSDSGIADDHAHPWLRISVNECTVVLRREHVMQLRNALWDFLDASEPV